MDKETLIKTAEALEELKRRKKYNLKSFLFNDKGKFSRENYQPHIDFIRAGANYHQRMFSAGNQTGKTTVILYEAICHATLDYPDWWPGFKFRRATEGILGAKNWDLLRDGVQAKLLGSFEKGTGLIPADCIVWEKCRLSTSGNGAYSYITVRNKLGTESVIKFKTYDAGKDSWESMTVDWVFFDEEPPMEIYTEGAIRTLQRKGVIALGFTPDSGLTETVMSFFKDGRFEAGAADGKYVTMVGWDDVPHLDPEHKRAMLALIPEHLREAKTRGVPYLGSGRVFQFDLNQFVIPPFEIPSYFERATGVDPGISRAGVLWGCKDPQTGVVYVYNELLSQNSSIRAVSEVYHKNGTWIPGSMDPQYGPQPDRVTGQRIIDIYKEHGLDLELCERRGKDGGIKVIEEAFLSGRLKIFSTCTQLFNQLQVYHRTDKGVTGRTPDDLIDALRYLINDGMKRAISEDDYFDMAGDQQDANRAAERDSITGY